MSKYDPAWPHSDITEIFDNVFMVTGTNKVKHGRIPLSFSRNMVIVRRGDDLTLINTVRLNETGLQQLEALGNVKNVVRMGAFHGRDDPFYVDRYQAEYWAIPGMYLKEGLSVDQELITNGPEPCLGCSVFVFDLPKQKECVLLLEQSDGILITCDSLQNRTIFDRYTSFISSLYFLWHNEKGGTRISSIWKNVCKPNRDDYDTILKMDFKHLITAHGKPVIDDGKKAVREAIEKSSV